MGKKTQRNAIKCYQIYIYQFQWEGNMLADTMKAACRTLDYKNTYNLNTVGLDHHIDQGRFI
jgi:hypothetical protein